MAGKICIVLWNIAIMCLSCVLCYSFNTKDVIVISDDSIEGRYFSYSLLLQKGNSSSVIVGAPKENNNPNNKYGGSIYRCNLDGHTSCSEFITEKSNILYNTNGDFLGSSLDGEDFTGGEFVACAPRTVIQKESYQYLKGSCLQINDSSNLNTMPIFLNPFASYKETFCCDYYGKHYYDFAFSMAGFDISYYNNQNRKEVLLGAPGIKKFNGATVSLTLKDHSFSLLPSKRQPELLDEETYLGYSVATGYFEQSRKSVWFIAGAPRANNLKGKVIIYQYDIASEDKTKVFATTQDDAVGSYFGSVILAVDVTNDNIDDLLIGAPMSSGNSWDEGCVYFYKVYRINSFSKKIKLTGSGKTGGRFGSAIASLGSFDLDPYNDVAISAPYEDDGVGAVYIYIGSTDGLETKYSQRLSPLDFDIGLNVKNSVKGFGLGLSRGNDIDNNGHNDIAIGAFKSDHLFVIKSFTIINYNVNLTSPTKSIGTSTENFNLKYCLKYNKVSPKNVIPEVIFNLIINLDYRLNGGKLIATISLQEGKTKCYEENVRLKKHIQDILPLHINLKVEVMTEKLFVIGPGSVELQIPYSHGCGDDNICTTGLSLELKSTSSTVVFGLNKQINMKVFVQNDGEPAYQCEVKIAVPSNIELRNFKDCKKDSSSKYSCLIGEIVTASKNKEFIFDIKYLDPRTENIEIEMEITSLGTNKDGYKEKDTLQIPVLLQSTPYIVGKTIPNNVEFVNDIIQMDVEVIHQFSVGKSGPSPLKLDVHIFVPLVEVNNQNIFEILNVKGSVGDVEVSCTPILYESIIFNPIDDLNVPINRTIIVSCYSEEQCREYSCQGEYLYDNSQVAVFEVKMVTKTNLLVAKYKHVLKDQDLIAYVPLAYQDSSNGRVQTSSQILIFIPSKTHIPLWIFIVAAVSGVILLALISYGLYRCNFFDRNYKDKLMQQRILESEGNSVIDDELYEEPIQPVGVKT